MSDRSLPDLTPAEEDPVLHGYLATLPQAMPSQGLQRRVLTRVWRPAPRWVREAEARWIDSVESGRIWFVLGAIAAGSLIPLAVTTGLLVTFSSQIGALSAWMISEFGPELSGLLAMYWAAATQSVTSWWAAVAPPNVGAWAAGGAGVVAVSAVGFIWTIRRGR
jgi:hypothetical protein